MQHHTAEILLCESANKINNHVLPRFSPVMGPGPQVAKLAELVTAWAVSRRCVLGREHSFNGVTRYHQLRKSSMDTEPDIDFESGPGIVIRHAVQ